MMEAIHVLGCRSMRSRGNAAAIAFLSVLLGGCAASMAIQAEGDPAVSFDSFGTYTWSQNQRTSRDVRVTPALRTQIRDDVDRHLTDKGYVRVNTGADFSVTYLVTIEGETIVQTLDYYRGSNFRENVARPAPTARRYEEGMLIIDIMQGESDRLIWRGTATAEVRQSPSMEDRSARVAEAVQKVLAEFPSR
jgi:hypothetical protein